MMKRYLLFLVIIGLFGCRYNEGKTETRILDRLAELEKTQSFFSMRSLIEKANSGIPEDYSEYYKGTLANLFGRSSESNQYFDALLSDKNILPDSLVKNIYEMKSLNHFNLSEYEEAYQSQHTISRDYIQYLDSSERKSLKNTLKIYNPLRNVPKQEVFKKTDIRIKFNRDKAGLTTLNIKMGQKNSDFIFDTGANISVIQASEAKKYNLKFLPSNFQVNALTGKKVQSRLAVADTLELDGITITNVVFMVFEDSDLSFPIADYEIKGIIGFPVIRAFQEIHITKNDELFIPMEPSDFKNRSKNLAINGLKPMVAVIYENDTLNFQLDTGASNTSLHASFYKKYEQKIKDVYPTKTVTSAGAGGMVEQDGFEIDSLTLRIHNKIAVLDSVNLVKSKLNDRDVLHGNLGQDYIRKFDRMIISFKESVVVFE